MILRSLLFIAGICSVFTLWAIAVSADDQKRTGSLSADIASLPSDAMLEQAP